MPIEHARQNQPFFLLRVSFICWFGWWILISVKAKSWHAWQPKKTSLMETKVRWLLVNVQLWRLWQLIYLTSYFQVIFTLRQSQFWRQARATSSQPVAVLFAALRSKGRWEKLFMLHWLFQVYCSALTPFLRSFCVCVEVILTRVANCLGIYWFLVGVRCVFHVLFFSFREENDL